MGSCAQASTRVPTVQNANHLASASTQRSLGSLSLCPVRTALILRKFAVVF